VVTTDQIGFILVSLEKNVSLVNLGIYRLRFTNPDDQSTVSKHIKTCHTRQSKCEVLIFTTSYMKIINQILALYLNIN